jgi:hypothetical protein
MNLSDESLYMNVFQLRGIAFTPDNVKPDIDREKVTPRPVHVVKLSRRNF